MKSRIIYYIFRYLLPWLNQNAGLQKHQLLFEKLYRLAIQGMNYGNGGNVAESGEHWALAFVKQKLQKKSQVIIVDAGANKGEYSQMVLSVFQDLHFHLYAFEPSQKTYRLLLENIGNVPNFSAINAGLSNKAEAANLYSDSDYSGMASVYQRKLDHLHIAFAGTEQVQLTTLDAFCDENNIENIDFLKLDVEGHELAVLQGAEKLLSQGKINIIQFEFGGCNLDSRTCFRDFFELLAEKYHISRILKDGFQPIAEYHELLEIFTTVNYLAVKK